MKVTRVRLRQVEGEFRHPDPFWEERLVRPTDVYPALQARGLPDAPVPLGEGRYLVRAVFLEVESDEGATGRSGPITQAEAFVIATQLRPLLLGADPTATELLWDQMYRTLVHGRKGTPMMALSAVDCALWDLRGRWLGVPVYRLLGGPTRERIPAYASALGYSLEPEAVRRRAQELVAQGYRAMKWFFRHGPHDGPEGVARNLALARTLRETVGDDVDLMFDCWMSWDAPYALAVGRRLAEYRPRWLEEPVLPDKVGSYVQVRRALPFPVSGGEHEYTRWGFKALLDAGAVDVLQPDIYWAGGVSEVAKVCALASAYDVPVVPHGHSVPATVHLLAAMPPAVCPLLEYLVKWNQVHQFFLREPVQPQGGVVALPQAPGLGMELDEAKVQRERELAWE